MNINCNAWNPSMQKTMCWDRWLEPECYKDPVDATDHAINIAEIALKLGGCNPNVKTTITISLEEYRLLISEAQRKAKEEGCKEGRKEAWDLARRIVTTGDDCYTGTEVLDSVFGSCNAKAIFGMPADDALSLDKMYQEGKNALHVGDEVEVDTDSPWHSGVCHGWVVNIHGETVSILISTRYGIEMRYVGLGICRKTGNTAEHLAQLIKAMKEER